MNLQDALRVLKENEVTESIQVLRRWVREGKIKGNMISRKEGYVIDRDSLYKFVDIKNEERLERSLSKDSEFKLQIQDFEDLVRLKRKVYDETIRQRDKELILKGLAEDRYSFSLSDFFKDLSFEEVLMDRARQLNIEKIKIIHLGDWLYDEKFNFLFDINDLPESDKSLKYRLKESYALKMIEHLEKQNIDVNIE